MDPINSGVADARGNTVPSRRQHRHADRGLAPGVLVGPDPADSGVGNTLPVLDWSNYAQNPTPDPDPCARHNHPPDPHCALAGWYLTRAARPGRALRLVTLTFDPSKLAPGADPRLPRDMAGRAYALRALGDWYRYGLRAVAPDVDALVGLEMHKSGARHAHALIGMDERARWHRAWRAWYDRHGASQGWKVRLRSDQAAAMYAAKYPGKELGVYGVVYGGGRLVVT